MSSTSASYRVFLLLASVQRDLDFLDGLRYRRLAACSVVPRRRMWTPFSQRAQHWLDVVHVLFSFFYMDLLSWPLLGRLPLFIPVLWAGSRDRGKVIQILTQVL